MNGHLGANDLLKELVGEENEFWEAEEEFEDYNELEDWIDNENEFEIYKSELEKFLQENQIKKKPSAHGTTNSSVCSICWEEKTSDTLNAFRVISSCGHQFCEGCLRRHVSVKLEDIFCIQAKESTKIVYETNGSLLLVPIAVQGIACPAFQCSHLITEEDIKFLPGSKDLLIRFRHLLEIIEENKNLASNQSQIPSCPKCKGSFQPCKRGRVRCSICLCVCCGICFQPHYLSTTCEEFEKKGNIRTNKNKTIRHSEQSLYKRLLSYIKQSGIRGCSNCLIPIEKNGGCLNMNCTNCKKPFVWTNAPLIRNIPISIVRP